MGGVRGMNLETDYTVIGWTDAGRRVMLTVSGHSYEEAMLAIDEVKTNKVRFEWPAKTAAEMREQE